MEHINAELKTISKRLHKILGEIFEELYEAGNITDRNLDDLVLEHLKDVRVSDRGFEMRFSEPMDSIYRAEARRTPYDLLSYGKINGKNFEIFINNKFGDLEKKSRNDITTYNNLLRLYLGISKQRLKGTIMIDVDKIKRRIAGEEIVAYGVFVVDKGLKGFNFFLLEEVEDDLYVNPRNTMLQLRYRPKIGDPKDYYSFCNDLIDAILEALQKNLDATRAEMLALKTIKSQLLNIRGNL